MTELQEMTRECSNHVQVVEVVPPGGEAIVIANVYDRQSGSERPAQKAKWGEIAKQKRVIIAGDMNAHSQMWNPRAKYRRNATFWEDLIEKEDLFIWNNEEATRCGPAASNHSIIDLTLASPNLDLEWSVLSDQQTGSDHEVIAWEVLAKEEVVGKETSAEVTGWDIRGWDHTWITGEDAEAAKKKRAEVEAFFRRRAGETPTLSDASTAAEVDVAAVALREAMTDTLDKFARKKRCCARSKRWWTEDLGKLRKELGRAKRNWRVAGMSRVQAARRDLRRAIRKAK